jgi:Universal stress protein family
LRLAWLTPGFVADKLHSSPIGPDPKVPYEHLLVAGDPVDGIVRVVDEEKADLIIMGTHGRRELMRVLMGSVAELVVRHANLPGDDVQAAGSETIRQKAEGGEQQTASRVHI